MATIPQPRAADIGNASSASNATKTPRAPCETMDEECARTLTPTQALYGAGSKMSSSSSSSSSSSAASVGSVTTKDVSLSAQPSCGCTSEGYVRGCSACLNQILDGQSCTLTSDGQCQAASDNDWYLDFRRHLVTNTSTGNRSINVDDVGLYLFPATNTTYCSYHDSICNACRQAWTQPSVNPAIAQLPFCRGQDGCVCVRSCWIGGSSSSSSYSEICAAAVLPARDWTSWTICVVAILSIAMVVLKMLNDRQRRVARAEAYLRLMRARFPSPSANDTAGVSIELFSHQDNCESRTSTRPQLELGGWQALREQLIQTERVNFQPHKLGDKI